MATEQLTDKERIEFETLKATNKLLIEAAAGVSIGYLMMKVKALEDRQDGIGSRLGTLEAKTARHEVEIPKLQSALSKARDTFAKMTAKTDDQKPAPQKPEPQGAKK